MPGPFPGMDPYLEDPARWPDVHQGLIGSARAILNTLLPPGYVASIGERCQIFPVERSIYPDVFVRSTPAFGGKTRSTAVMDAPDPPLIIEEGPIEPREVFIEIRSVADKLRVITAIELLSPANKAEGSDGRRSYLQKQQELLASQTHLIEIDLLRMGKHTAAVPIAQMIQKPPYTYLTCLHRGGQGKRFEVWPVSLPDRLPRIAVPLEEGVPDVTLDLQAVFDRNYEEGAYALQIDYAAEAIPPLDAKDAVWADSLLRADHLR